MLKNPVHLNIRISLEVISRLENLRGPEDSMARIARQALEIGIVQMERKRKSKANS